MDKEPKKPGEQNDAPQQEEQGYMMTNIPLTIVVSALINSKGWFDWILRAAETLVIFVLTYQILGKALFVVLVVTPLLICYVERCLECYDMVMYGGDDDDSSDDGGDDSHFGDHFNNLMK